MTTDRDTANRRRWHYQRPPEHVVRQRLSAWSWFTLFYGLAGGILIGWVVFGLGH